MRFAPVTAYETMPSWLIPGIAMSLVKTTWGWVAAGIVSQAGCFCSLWA